MNQSLDKIMSFASFTIVLVNFYMYVIYTLFKLKAWYHPINHYSLNHLLVNFHWCTLKLPQHKKIFSLSLNMNSMLNKKLAWKVCIQRWNNNIKKQNFMYIFNNLVQEPSHLSNVSSLQRESPKALESKYWG